MKIEKKLPEGVRQNIKAHGDRMAPYPVVARLLSLTGDAPVKASSAEVLDDEKSTTWAVTWVTNQTVAHVRVRRDGDSAWRLRDDAFFTSSRNEDGMDVVLEAWARPVEEITRLETGDVRTWFNGGSWGARVALVAHFRDGGRLKLGTDVLSSNDDKETDNLVLRELRSVLGCHS